MMKKQTRFTESLLNWYDVAARPLPWRGQTDPYAIWVSEVMLQQTQVDTVIPYYQRFLQRYPTLHDLAAADEHDVLKLWEGLGYYRRARLLHQGVREVSSTYGGNIPSDPKTLRSLPGIGEYMAGSIASIAFNRPTPAVDGNVIRVVTRILALSEEESAAGTRRMIRDWVQDRIPTERAGDFAQALMELGALICRPKGPRCDICPVREDCQAKDQEPEAYPVKRPGRRTPVEQRAAYLIWRDGRFYMEQRPQEGLLAGMWELPHTLMSEVTLKTATVWAGERFGAALPWKLLRNYRQTFSHLTWVLWIYEARCPAGVLLEGEHYGGWFTPEEAERLPRVAYVRELTERIRYSGSEEENA